MRQWSVTPRRAADGEACARHCCWRKWRRGGPGGRTSSERCERRDFLSQLGSMARSSRCRSHPRPYILSPPVSRPLSPPQNPDILLAFFLPSPPLCPHLSLLLPLSSPIPRSLARSLPTLPLSALLLPTLSRFTSTRWVWCVRRKQLSPIRSPPPLHSPPLLLRHSCASLPALLPSSPSPLTHANSRGDSTLIAQAGGPRARRLLRVSSEEEEGGGGEHGGGEGCCGEGYGSHALLCGGCGGEAGVDASEDNATHGQASSMITPRTEHERQPELDSYPYPPALTLNRSIN